MCKRVIFDFRQAGCSFWKTFSWVAAFDSHKRTNGGKVHKGKLAFEQLLLRLHPQKQPNPRFLQTT